MRNKTFASLLRGKRREGCIHGINNSKGRTNKRRFPAVFFLAIHHILVVSHRLWHSLSFLPAFDSIKFFYLDQSIYIYIRNEFLISKRILSLLEFRFDLQVSSSLSFRTVDRFFHEPLKLHIYIRKRGNDRGKRSVKTITPIYIKE